MIPNLTCSAVRTDDPSHTVSLDLSRALANLDHQRAIELLRKFQAREAIYVQEISGSIPDDWREAFWASNVRIPDLYERAAVFITAISGVSGLRSWQALAKARQEAEWNVTSAQKLRDAVHKARFVTLSQSSAPMLFDEISGTYSDADEAVDHAFSHEDLVAAVGQPDWTAPDSERAEHTTRSNAWVRANARPFAFSTTPRIWAGLTQDALVAILEDEPDLNEGQFLDRAWTSLETDLSDNHFEEAHEALRRHDDLTSALKTWFADHRLTTTAGANAFDAVRSWNESQQITSYFPDMTTIVGLFADVTPQEVRDWVDNFALKAAKAVEAINRLWRANILVPESAIAAAAKNGISLICEPRRSTRQAWRWVNTSTGESSPKFMTLELCVEALPPHLPETGQAA